MKKYRIIITIAVLLCSIEGFSQKWNWELGLGGSQNSGNVNNFNLRHNQGVTRNDSTLSIDLNYKIVYQKDNGKESNKGIESGIKLDLFQFNRWSPFVASELISNHYKGYKLKVRALSGIKYILAHDAEKYNYSLSAAVVYENVNYTSDKTELNKDICRLSVRPKLMQKIGNTLTIKSITFYQPNVKEFGDYMIDSRNTLENKITSKLFLDINFNYEFRSKIPDDVKKKYDITTEISIKVKL